MRLVAIHPRLRYTRRLGVFDWSVSLIARSQGCRLVS